MLFTLKVEYFDKQRNYEDKEVYDIPLSEIEERVESFSDILEALGFELVQFYLIPQD